MGNSQYIGTAPLVLKTTNGGLNWFVQTNNSSGSLLSVYFTNLNNGYGTTSEGEVVRTTNGGINWSSQKIGSADQLRSVFFTDINTGYIVGGYSYANIYKTTDAGITWISCSTGTGQNLNSVSFVGIDTGYVVGRSVINGTETIRKTTNGGTTWEAQELGFSNIDIYSVYFLNANKGFIGIDGDIGSTTNGGLTWDYNYLHSYGAIRSFFFVNNNVGYAGCNGDIYQTLNGGQYWTFKTTPNSDPCNSIYFFDVNVGYVACGSGRIYKTTDGGTHWISQTSGTTNDLKGIYFTDANTGYGVGDGIGILKTTNGGTNWFNSTSGSVFYLNSIYFVDNNIGYAIGSKILKTTNAGISWVEQNNPTTYGLNGLCFINAKTGYAVGDRGTILKTTTGGEICTGIAGKPTGSSELCQPASSQYSTTGATNATSYIWNILPNNAGTISGNGLTATVDWSGSFTGTAYISVKGTNSCGEGPESEAISVTVEKNSYNAGIISGNTTVCQGTNTFIYTVPEITNATSYIWTLPEGAIGSSSTKSIAVIYGPSSISGNITVRGHSNCGDGDASTLPINVNPLPIATGSISGPYYVCQGQNGVIYSIPIMTSATSYEWTLPDGATGISSSNSITVNYGLNAISGYITVRGLNSCGWSDLKTLSIEVSPLPANIGLITGPSYFCRGQNNVIYSVSEIAYTNSYIWTLPVGATGSSNTRSISVNYGPSAISGSVTVKGNNYCGNGISSTLPVSLNYLPEPAGSISGPTIVCQGQTNVTYTVPEITNAVSYIWTLPNGVTGTSTTNSITVNFEASASSGNIIVKGNSACGDGVYSFISITVNPLPENPGAITGPANVCKYQTGITYTVPVITNAETYIWSLPDGVVGNSTTNTIIVDYTSTATSGVLSVRGNNSCGNGAISSININVNQIPANATSIFGPTTVCQGQNNVTYAVTAIPNATSYIWTLPNGTIGASSFNFIDVAFGPNAVSGNVTVKGHNYCGDGIISTLPIIVNPLPSNAGNIIGNTNVCQGQNENTYTVPETTNINSYIWTLPIGATGASTTNSITVNYLFYALSGNIIVKGHNSCGDGVSSSLAITVNSKPSTPVITQNLSIITSNTSNGNQWYFNGSAIPGATNQSHTCNVNGDYYDIVTLNGCSSDPSNTININNVGMVFIENNKTFKVYPNPVSNELIIEINGNTEKTNFEILNAIGQIVFKGNLIERTIVNISTFSNGLYMIKFENGKTFEFKKIVKE